MFSLKPIALEHLTPLKHWRSRAATFEGAGARDLLQQRVLYLEERIRALEEERPSLQARLSWIEQLLQKLRQCFQ